MAPKTKYSKEIILNCAFDMVRQNGIEVINAREIAKHLGCSTQPLFHVFNNMEELMQNLYAKTEELYNNRMEKAITQPDPFAAAGFAYVQFARDERNLFKLLFMSNHFKVSSAFEMIEEDKEFIETISKSAALSYEAAKKLYVNMWLLTHGIASMIATNSFSPSDEEVKRILFDTYKGLLYQLRL